MNRAELIETLAERAELTKAQTARMLDAVLEVITTTIAAGEQVALIGFGTFKRALRAAREGRNPATGATLKIAAAKLPKFAAGATLKAAVAGKKTAPKKTTPKPAAKKAETKPVAKKPAAKSPMVGTVYHAPEPGAKPFVTVGQSVSPGDQICIIEVMKLMTAIKAEWHGVIAEILVADAEMVEHGQELFVISGR